MKSLASFSESSDGYRLGEGVYLTPSEVIEHLYCPRFTYFMNCLSIPQHEEQRYKVLKGRELHEERKKINKEYLRKKIGCIRRDFDVYMASPRYCIRGIVDEVLHLVDGTLAPFDYKFAEYKERLFQTYRCQSALYALLIKENYDREVKRGYVCYTRSKHLVKEVEYSDSDFRRAQGLISEVLQIIQTGYYPKRTKYLSRCIDCCYKNICI